jgi:hypothetical protein
VLPSNIITQRSQARGESVQRVIDAVDGDGLLALPGNLRKGRQCVMA